MSPLCFDKDAFLRTISACVLALVTATGMAIAQDPKATVARWPQDRAAAISLTFDDGLNSQLDHAGPILRKHHLNGTFFVSTGLGPWEKRKGEWKELAREGNELGDHTVRHPCLLAQIKPHSQDYTPEMMEGEIRDAALEITRLLNWRRGLTFAYPCGNMSFGKPEHEVRNAALYARYVSENAFGARGVAGSGATDPDELNVLAINDLGSTDGKSFASLLVLATPAIQSGNWGVYCFHGVGGDWLSITPEALDELATHLERHSEIWTATFGDVLRYIQERKAASISLQKNSDGSFDIGVNVPLEAQVYDLPLTLKVEVPDTWIEARVMDGNNSVATKVLTQQSKTLVVFDVAPQTKTVHLVNVRQ